MEGFKPYHKTMTDFLKVIPETHQDESNQGTPKQATLNKQVNTVSQPLLQADGIHSIPGSFHSIKKKLDLDLTKEAEELMQFMDEIEQEKEVEKMSPMPANAPSKKTATDTGSQTENLPPEQIHAIPPQLIEELASTRQALETSQQAEQGLQDKVKEKEGIIQAQQAQNLTLSDKNQTLDIRVEALSSQLKSKDNDCEQKINLIKQKASEVLANASSIQEQSDTLLLENQTLRRENTSLLRQVATLRRNNTALLQELEDSASAATDDDTRSSISASSQELSDIQEAFTYEPSENNAAPEQDAEKLAVYQDIMQQMTYNLEEFKKHPNPQDSPQLVETLLRLAKSIPS